MVVKTGQISSYCTKVINTTQLFEVKIDSNNTMKDYKSVINVQSKIFNPMPTIFKVTKRNYQGRKVTVPSTPEILVKYWSEKIISTILENSNNYREKKKIAQPNHSCWKGLVIVLVDFHQEEGSNSS